MLQALLNRETGLNRNFTANLASKLASNLELSRQCFQHTFASSINCLNYENVEDRYMLTGYGNGHISIYDMCVPFTENIIPTVASIDRSVPHCHNYSVEDIQWYPHDTGLFVSLSTDRTLKIWDTNELQMAEQFSFLDDIYSFHLSEKAKKHSLVAVSCKDSKIYLCDMKSGSKTHYLKGHKGAVLTLKWSPRNENILVSGSSDKHIYLWDVRKAKSILMSLNANNGNDINTSTAHDGHVNGLEFTSDGLNLLSFGTDHQLRLWDVNSGDLTKVNYGRVNNNLNKNIHFAVSKGAANDLVYIPTECDIDVFEIYTGKYVRSMSGHFMTVNCCCYNHNYQELYSGSADSKILHWTSNKKVSCDAHDFVDDWSDYDN